MYHRHQLLNEMWFETFPSLRTLSTLDQRPPFLKVKAQIEPIFVLKDYLLNGANTLIKININLFCSLPMLITVNSNERLTKHVKSKITKRNNKNNNIVNK